MFENSIASMMNTIYILYNYRQPPFRNTHAQPSLAKQNEQAAAAIMNDSANSRRRRIFNETILSGAIFPEKLFPCLVSFLPKKLGVLKHV